jgi:hypothetical protein
VSSHLIKEGRFQFRATSSIKGLSQALKPFRTHSRESNVASRTLQGIGSSTASDCRTSRSRQNVLETASNLPRAFTRDLPCGCRDSSREHIRKNSHEFDTTCFSKFCYICGRARSARFDANIAAFVDASFVARKF